MTRFKILIEYKGANYVGWQKQENGKSIQEVIENSIKKLTGEKRQIFAAGRTDAGVHGLGQVAHFDLKKNLSEDTIRDGLNSYLRSESISILDAKKTTKDFHARFSAKKRWYEYKIINRRPPLTIDLNRAWCVYKSLDIEKIKSESSSFLGKHDFNAFRSAHCQSKNSIKTIDSVSIKNKDEQIIFEVSAKSFLHSQVRIMIGTLVDIAKGNINKTVLDIINSKQRDFAGQTAPANGLYLKKIEY